MNLTRMVLTAVILVSAIPAGGQAIEGVTVIRGTNVTVYSKTSPDVEKHAVTEIPEPNTKQKPLPTHTVQITGAVERPGFYPWHAGMTLGELLAKARPMRITGMVLIATLVDERQKESFLLPVQGDARFKESVKNGQKIEVERQRPTKYY